MKTHFTSTKNKGDFKIRKVNRKNFLDEISAKTKMLLAFIIGGLILTVILVNSNPNETKKTLKYGDDLKTAIDNFEKSREGFSEDVSNIANDAIEELNSENPDIPKIVQDWESGWNELKESMNHLENRFLTVGKQSDEYFSEMEQLTSEVMDRELRTRELTKNRELKERWVELYSEASVKIQDVRKLIQKGEDIQKILLVFGLREKVEANINELHEITREAELLSKELEKFTLEGKSLILGA